MLLAEYALDWGLPGLYGWYFSGDDDNPNNGSERLPYLATTNNLTNSLSTFGYRGNPIMVPFTSLRKLVAHKQQLFAREGPHPAVIGAQVGKLLP